MLEGDDGLGFDPEDVRDIVLTHLDFDHAGGLDDFPQARIHLMTRERDSAVAQRTVLDRMRYRPAQWSTRPHWVTHPMDSGESWYGFEGARAIPGCDDQLLMVPLIGHTLGHCGVAVRQPTGWELVAGDAYFYHREMDLDRPHCTPGLRLYQWLMEKDRSARLANQARLRELKRSAGAEVQIYCSHDVTEFERVAGRRYDQPAHPAGVISIPRGAPRFGSEHHPA